MFFFEPKFKLFFEINVERIIIFYILLSFINITPYLNSEVIINDHKLEGPIYNFNCNMGIING